MLYTSEELETAKTELLESISSSEELSDRELEEVAGGSVSSIIGNLIIPITMYGGPGLWDEWD